MADGIRGPFCAESFNLFGEQAFQSEPGRTGVHLGIQERELHEPLYTPHETEKGTGTQEETEKCQWSVSGIRAIGN